MTMDVLTTLGTNGSKLRSVKQTCDVEGAAPLGKSNVAVTVTCAHAEVVASNMNITSFVIARIYFLPSFINVSKMDLARPWPTLSTF